MEQCFLFHLTIFLTARVEYAKSTYQVYGSFNTPHFKHFVLFF